MSRCRLCTTNDPEVLRNEIAAEMWAGRVSGVSWADAGPYWRYKMLELADDAMRAMRREQPVDDHPQTGIFRERRRGD